MMNCDFSDLGEIVAKVKRLLADGCGCSWEANGGYSSQQFQEEAVLSNQNNCLKLSSGEHNLVINYWHPFKHSLGSTSFEQKESEV